MSLSQPPCRYSSPATRWASGSSVRPGWPSPSPATTHRKRMLMSPVRLNRVRRTPPHLTLLRPSPQPRLLQPRPLQPTLLQPTLLQLTRPSQTRPLAARLPPNNDLALGLALASPSARPRDSSRERRVEHQGLPGEGLLQDPRRDEDRAGR